MNGTELRALREREGLSQEEIGAKHERTGDAIRRYEVMDKIPEMMALEVTELLG